MLTNHEVVVFSYYVILKMCCESVCVMNKDEAYDFLCKVAEGISLMFGPNCETIIHEMNGQRIKNLAVYNGHVTGRKAGSTTSIFGKDTAIEEETQQDLDFDYQNQMVLTPSGRQIKSSTYHLRGEDYHYALGINFDITVMEQMRGILKSMTRIEGDLLTSIEEKEHTNVESAFNSCLEMVNRPLDKMKKGERLMLVKMLKEKGVFNLQKSVPYVAERMGVRKYTIYNYLNELENI